MAISRSMAYLLLRSLGVYVPRMDDNRMNNIVNQYHPSTPTAVNGATARVSACVSRLDPNPIVPNAFLQQRFNRAKDVLDFINFGGNSVLAARQRIDVAELVLVHLGLPLNALTAANVGNTLPICGEWPNLTGPEQTSVAEYTRSRAANTAVGNLVSLANVVGALPHANLQTIAAITNAVNAVRPADPQRFSGITPVTFGDLRTLFALHAPNSRFGGFAAWGPGDHHTPPRNLRWHFLKHVLGIVEEGAEPNDPAEQVEWWEVLRIQLTWAQVQQHGSGHPPLAPYQNLFYGPNNSLTHANVANFLGNVELGDHPRLVAHLCQTYEIAYHNEAIQRSQHMNETLVQSNGIKTFISGSHSRGGHDLFIIGRLDNGVLGISSCYFTSDIHQKMAVARANKVWDLT